ADWITIPSSSGLLIENNPAQYTVAPNPGAARVGKIMIGGYVFTVNQAGQPCSFTLSQSSNIVGIPGGTGSFGVTPSPSTCSWTATPSNSSVSITSGASGKGKGTVNYKVVANTGGPNNPSITVASGAASAVFNITQASAFNCTFTLQTYKSG